MSSVLSSEVEPTPLAIDEEVGRRCYGMAWADCGVQHGAHIYAIADPNDISAHIPIVPQPLMFRQGMEFVDVQGIPVMLNIERLPRPSLDEGAAWGLLRFVARSHGLQILTCHAEHEAIEHGGRSTVALSQMVSGTAPVATHTDRSFVRAAARAALKAMDWVESRKASAVAPPNG